MMLLFPSGSSDGWADVQSLHLGRAALESHGLVPGSTAVRCQLECGTSLLCRAWLHGTPQLLGGEAGAGVWRSGPGCIGPPDLTSGVQLSQLEAVQVELVDRLEVEVVRDRVELQQISRLPALISSLLRGLVLAPGYTVTFTRTARQLTGVWGVRVGGAGTGAVQLEPGGGVVVTGSVSRTRLELLAKGEAANTPLGGVETALSQVTSSLSSGRTLLLSGPSGSGKSALLASACHALALPALHCDCLSLARPAPGEAEAALRQVWGEACSLAGEGGVLLVLDSVEWAGQRGGGRGGRLAAQLSSLLDRRPPGLLVVGLTSQPDLLCPALRRPGRLEVEVVLAAPDCPTRAAMLTALATRLDYSTHTTQLARLAAATAGWLAADLALLLSRLARQPHLSIESAVADSRPATLRAGRGVVEAAPVTWDSIGGLAEVKAKLVRAVQLPLTHPASFTRLGVRPCRGLLLTGPPGCGKTRLVRALASSCQITFLAASAAEIFSPWVGDSERAVVELFSRARRSAPAILFLDELEAVVAGRDAGGRQSCSDRVLAALLTEMDGLGGEEERGGRVVVVGATNRPELLDPALTRPGRLDTLLPVPPPGEQDRQEILSTLLKTVPHGELDLAGLATSTAGFTGADLECLVREAALLQLARDLGAARLHQECLDTVTATYQPSLARTS